MSSRWPLCTAALPGTGGTLKSEPEDFEVEEQGELAPSGAGEHLWLWVQKRDLEHFALLDRLAAALDIAPGDIGYAGMKDRRAITRQWLSVPARLEGRVAGLDVPDLRVLRAVRHSDKLRTGRLSGNRFSVRLRDTHPEALERAQAVLDELTQRGLANYYGAQRFGHADATLQQGRAALQAIGAGSRPSVSGRRLRLVLSAVQSHLYNDVLGQRVADGLLYQCLPGDVVLELRTGLWRWVEVRELEAAAEAYAAHRWVPTGPMFGIKMRQPRGLAKEREVAVLTAAGLSLSDFAKTDLTAGTRRPLVVWPKDASVEPDPAGLRLQFTLPAGAYATELLREVMKSPAAASSPDVASAPEVEPAPDVEPPPE